LRRHRINNIEVEPVKEAVLNELRALCQERRSGELWKTQMLFRVYWRLEAHRQGQPNYPDPLDWPTMSGYLMVPFYPLEKVIPFRDMELLSVGPRADNLLTSSFIGADEEDSK